MDVQFTDREVDVMEVLWERGPSLVAEVQAALQDELAYTTVMTVFDNLHRKGWLTRELEGRAYRYTPALTRDQYVAQTMHDALVVASILSVPMSASR